MCCEMQMISAFLVLSILCGLTNTSIPSSSPPASSSSVPLISTSTPQPTVSLGYANYSGIPFFDAFANSTNTQFLGIRYAAPPTGSSRWAEPQPPQTTHGVQSADRQPVQCMQSPYGSKGRTPFRDNSTSKAVSARTVGEGLGRREWPDESEDCLFLKYVSLFPGCTTDKFPIC